MQKPIFYDPSGKRKKASLVGLMVLIGLAVTLSVALIVSILYVPKPADLDLHMEYPQRGASKVKSTHSVPHHPPLAVRRGVSGVNQQVMGFYVSWSDPGHTSLERHVNNIDVVLPVLAYVGGPDHKFRYKPDDKFNELINNAQHKPAVYVVLQNFGEDKTGGTYWDSTDTPKMLSDPAARKTLIAEVADMLHRQKAQGVVFDFEAMPESALPAYLDFLRQAHAALGAQGFKTTLTAPVDAEEWNLKAFSQATDRIFLMMYDEHSRVDTAGPIAAQPWFNDKLAYALKEVDPAKAVVCIGNWAYDWYKTKEGKNAADNWSVEEAWLIAHDAGAQVQFDPASGNPYFFYDEDGIHHEVWMLDAVTAWNQMRSVNDTNVSGVALWYIGSEDPSIWRAFRDFQGYKAPDLNKLTTLGDAAIFGNGEVDHIDDTPKDGSRVVTFDKNLVAQNEVYGVMPTQFVVRRTGYIPKTVALTFDDGPDGRWTPQILKILKQENVPATFFVIGEKALVHHDLLKQMVREGHEIGNHSYTHPDMSKVPDWEIRVELNSTQRVVEAYTGRAMRLVRPPFFGDAEPTERNELIPAQIAQEQGYTVVGLHVDSEDWQKPGVQAIVDNVMDGVHAGEDSETSQKCQDDPDESGNCRSGNIILMHDSGGIRTETIAALPIIIRQLKAEGYRLVTVGQLVGQTQDQIMPKLTGRQLFEARLEVGIFESVAFIAEALKWLFIVAIVLGITRALSLSALAIYAEYSGHMEPPEGARGDDPAAFVKSTFVSVIIPAYNEARVIEASVKRVLKSRGVDLEVIVVDDGSKDDTSAIVAKAFGKDARVTLITQVNAGKANAVNNGIQASKGEIIIALDADTQFEPETIARLVRWFVKPEIAAVAGNAKVGNRFNFVTKWQSVEYITAQNLERSALAMFGAMMVVPGAVGAWRRTALDEAGRYPHNTLAEDQDLTIAVQRLGWEVAYDQEAVAWTEAPESFKALMKQRFRWAYGTLQCLWKHQRVFKTRRPKGLAWIGLPQAWIFQIGFSVISPLIDFALVVNIVDTVVQVSMHGWAQNDTDITRMLIYWVAFLTIDALCGAIAYWLEPREKSYPVFWLLSQRFVYRQIMYYVVLKALMSAWRGLSVGWGKLERSGRIEAPRAEDLPAPEDIEATGHNVAE
jgi:cellulose synthase/poly-beta-1,6-N-acetylglucosamine synthase-like glycosyltransferase/peptidoglycan/xylan/chitin deacetylase (PgdA/CDA1 family)/spore germination protein YaaH